MPFSYIKRVDADTLDKLIESDFKSESVLSDTDKDRVKLLFEEGLNDKKLNISVEAMPIDELPVVITVPEFMRRMNDMAATSGQNSMFGTMPLMYNVAINANHAVTQKILSVTDKDAQSQMVKHAYNLALLSQGMLSGSELTAFIQEAAGRL